MSERRSLPPMQYAPPEDGHANHDAIRPERAARFQHFSTVECAAAGFPKLARLFAENSGAASSRYLAAFCNAVHFIHEQDAAAELSMPKARDEQIVVRVPAPLKGNLQRSADAADRGLSDHVRRILIDAEIPQTQRRELQEGISDV